MNEFRIVLSVLLWSTNVYLIFDLALNGFNWFVFFIIILFFILGHFIWPKKTNYDHAWFELLELIIELPFRLLTSFIRMIGRLFKSGDGLDIDL